MPDYPPDHGFNEQEPDSPYSEIPLEEPAAVDMGFEPNNTLPLEEPSIGNDSSLVASAPARNIIILVILALIAGFVLYRYVFKEDPKTLEAKKNQQLASQQPIEQAQKLTPEIEKPDIDFRQVEEPSLPEIGTLNKDAPPPPALDSTVDVPPALTNIPSPIPSPPALDIQPAVQEPVALPPDVSPPKLPEASAPAVVAGPSGPTPEELAAALKARRLASMLLVNGGGEPTVDENAISKNGTLLASNMAASPAAKSLATLMSNTDYLIAQGKMITAVLETAINTDLPGGLRAVISRDIYAESGRQVLIPKGSRLLGNYANAIARGQRRVLVTWTRVILPNGIDIQIGSPGTDRLGRSGVRGLVDNKYFELFKNSILVSSLSIGGALLLESAGNSTGVQQSSTTSNNGDVTNTQSGTTSDFAQLKAIDDLSNISTKIAEQLLNAQPTITIDQGTIINVFVNRDLIFPADRLNGGLNIVK